MSMRSCKSLSRRRNVRLYGVPLEYVSKFCYLGVWFGEDLCFNETIVQFSARAMSAFSGLMSVVHRNWGLRGNTLRLIYRGVVESILSYASVIWYRSLDAMVRVKILVRAQRFCLLTMCRAYRTVSSDALPVICGVLPIELLVRMRVKVSVLKSEGLVAGRAKVIAFEEALAVWQDRWGTAIHGRVTSRFSPNVSRRMKLKFYNWSHYSCQFLSGHGNFAFWLNSRGLLGSATCRSCGLQDETVSHVLFYCPVFNGVRLEFYNEIIGAGGQWSFEGLVSSPRVCGVFVKFCDRLGELREGL